MKQKLIYLASPYSKYPDGKEAAFQLACRKAGELMNEGHNVFCPIAHSHPVEASGVLQDVSHDFWLKQDFAVLTKCTNLYVYMMPGWEESHGVGEEVKLARWMGIPITYLDYEHALA